jgi:hypothetical protein
MLGPVIGSIGPLATCKPRYHPKTTVIIGIKNPSPNMSSYSDHSRVLRQFAPHGDKHEKSYHQGRGDYRGLRHYVPGVGAGVGAGDGGFNA